MMNYFSFWNILVLMFAASSLFGQAKNIHYYMPDSASKAPRQLMAKIGDATYQLLDSSNNCYAIEAVKDFNNDGLDDVLVEEIHGCKSEDYGSSYFFFSYYNGQFSKTASRGFVWGNPPELKELNGQWSVVILASEGNPKASTSEVVLEQFILQKDSLVVIYNFRPSVPDQEVPKEGEIPKEEIPKKEALPVEQSLASNSYFFEYKVSKKGESLWTIAKKHKTSIGAIKALNGRVRDMVKTGEILKIPRKGNHLFYIHVVQVGETLWQIGQKYKVAVDKIQAANELEGNKIKFGTILKIPK